MIDPAHKASALAFDQLLVTARRLLGPDVTVLRLHILINVYLNEGMNQRALLERLDMISVTALSRNLADLSPLTSSKREGPGLIELRSDPMNLRSKSIHLTARGRAAMKALFDEASDRQLF